MGFTDRFVKVFRSVLPAPFTIAVLLCVLTCIIALLFTSRPEATIAVRGLPAAPGEEVTLSASEASNYLWAPNGEISRELTVRPESGEVYSVTIGGKNNQYENSASIRFEEQSGKLVVFVEEPQADSQFFQVVNFWENGMWESSLLAFAIQMMLMLVLGHALALTKPVSSLISTTVRYCNTTATAAAIVTFLTVLVSLFNWGLGLIFGAIVARKVGEHAASNNLPINYALIGAAGYSGLMVWHGGISGSSLAKVAEPGHLHSLMAGIMPDSQLLSLPAAVPFEETVFSGMNILVSLALVVVLPLGMYILGKRSAAEKLMLPDTAITAQEKPANLIGAERLDHSRIVALTVGAFILGFALYRAIIKPDVFGWGFITPNFINLVLLGLCVLLHGSFVRFLRAIDSAIGGAAGILIQFPLYFGIMGIMKSSGLVIEMSEFFVSISTETTYPLFTFLSAGVVNIFVPSGGGQWMVQGPIIVQSAMDLGISLSKSILALAYGDQITNMMQPFWALPLLGITGLKAKEILPYTLFLMMLGTCIFIGALLVF